jgi:hypothetical protein
MSFYTENGHQSWIHHRRVERSEDEYSIRSSQVHQRSKEVKRVLDVVGRIDAGDYVENILQADNKKSEMDLTLFKNAFDLSCPILCGKNLF